MLDNPVPVQPLPVGYGAKDTAAPSPNADCRNAPSNEVLGCLPRANAGIDGVMRISFTTTTCSYP